MSNNTQDWIRPDRCPEAYRHPGNLKCRLDGEGGIEVLPPRKGPNVQKSILNWARHHRKCTAWKKDLGRANKPRFAFVNEHYGEKQEDGCGYAHMSSRPQERWLRASASDCSVCALLTARCSPILNASVW